ncbi:hypothetical protein [Deinococcus aquatilis]|jgi:hypothetical protein|uniref:hypothetical protein n=1 Tax=Deinococcus aquatilis TaxID=519440 RepID=UPI0012FC7B25|nr:hypothetical protein [Deinococcus aquatilis]
MPFKWVSIVLLICPPLLIGCQARKKTPTNPQIQMFQLEPPDDVWHRVARRFVRQLPLTSTILVFPDSVRVKDYRNLILFNTFNHTSHLIGQPQYDKNSISFHFPKDWISDFTYKTKYLILSTDNAKPENSERLNIAEIYTEEEPIEFEWLSSTLQLGTGRPVIKAQLRNATGFQVSGGQFKAELVCDQRSAQAHRAVSFSADLTAFGPQESREIVLNTDRQNDFRSDWLADVPFQKCRNHAIQSTLFRRSVLRVASSD